MDNFTLSNVIAIIVFHTAAAFIIWRRVILDSNGYTLHRVFIGTFLLAVDYTFVLVILGRWSLPLDNRLSLVLVLLGGLSSFLAALTIGGYRKH